MIHYKSTGVKVVCALFRTLKLVWRIPLMGKREHNMAAPRRMILSAMFSAKCSVPEPSERRAAMGFCKRTIFYAQNLCFGFVFLRAKIGFYKCTLFRVTARFSCIFGRAGMGFFCIQFLMSGRRSVVQQSASQ